MRGRVLGVLLFLLIYVFSYTVGFILVRDFENIFLRLFLFDLIATGCIFSFSIVVKNASLYDAYWSLTPMVMVVYLLLKNSVDIFTIIFVIVFLVWSLRLTINWVITFKDFRWEDWRYKKYRSEHNKFVFQIINLFGIEVMPTLLVFGAFLPVIQIIESGVGAYSIPGILILLLGISLEFFADRGMHSFLRSETRAMVCKVGLWKYSRHPNYLGEILIWVGSFIAFIPYNLDYWYFGIGMILIICLFEFISIPLMEKRQLTKRPDYKEYIQTTSRLLVLPTKK